jgi:poly(3-hydroxybutyrate) depolymerase
LDSSIVFQVIAGRSDAIEGSRGLVERLIVARSDNTLEPFALYVPNSLRLNPSLVVLLHGRPQTESEILSAPYFRALADSTGTIIAAPYGRGIYDFAPPADAEVYQIEQQVASAFNVDSHHVYLVGYSMGGFSVFKIGPEHQQVWSAIMCIAGSVLNSEAATVQAGFQNTRIYVVNGARDQSIPPRYGELTAGWLAGVGIPTGFYQQPKGTHYLSTLMPVLSRAWHDMLSGSISPEARPAAGKTVQFPQTQPDLGTMKP